MKILPEQDLLKYLRANFPKENSACEWKEFKRLKNQVSGTAGSDLVSYVSAIANMDGGALVIGLGDDFKIVGIEDCHNYSPDNLPQILVDLCPNLSSEGLVVDAFETAESGKAVWVLHIPRHLPRLPVYAHRKAWQRINDSLVEMRSERLEAILSECLNQSDWSAEIVLGADVNDLDPEAISIAREKYTQKNQNARFAGEISHWDLETFLDKAQITIRGQITRTALLLLGRPEATHYLPTLPQITWKLVGEEKAYQHFGPPFLLSTTDVLHRIRNVGYKFFPDDQLLATEVSKYDTRVILEALHNCLAHQDYTLKERTIVTEKVDRLIFENAGSFFEGKPEDYYGGGRTPSRYRNPWLVRAMVNLNMIDTVGDGIHSMTLSQRSRYFPLPDYHLSTSQKVVLEIYGHTIDQNYTRLLMERRDLPLTTVILLDQVQKKRSITPEAANLLKKEGLIEGRKPNYFVSARVAKVAGNKADYIRNRAFDDAYYKELILSYLKRFGSASRGDLENLILDKLSDALDEQQKRNKFRNLLHSMSRKDKSIEKSGSKHRGRWELTKD